MAHGGTHLHELLDRGLDLAVEDAPISDDDHRVEDLITCVITDALEANQLVSQPGDRVRLAAAGRVLDEVALARAMLSHIGESLPHELQLVIPRPHLLAFFLAGAWIWLLHDLGVVLKDVGEALRGEHLAPEVVGFEALGVGRVAGAVVMALIERQKPRPLALEFGAHPHLAVVHREVHHAAAEGKQRLARVPVALVLHHCVGNGLLGEAVLELEGGERQPIDEQAQIKGAASLVVAVSELARHRETVQGV